MTNHLYDIFKHWGSDIYCISDPHFSDLESYKMRFPVTFQEGTESIHSELVKQLDEEQIRNINAKAGRNSTLIILGDIGNIECVKKLKARYKILIMGNHDKGASNYKRTIISEEDKSQLYYSGYEEDVGIISSKNPEEIMNRCCECHIHYVRKQTDNHLFDEVYEGPLMVNDRLILSHEPINIPNYLFNIHGHIHNKNYTGDSNHLNVCAESIHYTPINLLSLIKNGLLKDIENIHRKTIDIATERKNMYEN